MKLLNQPFDGHLGDHLIELLDSPAYGVCNIVVAFAKNSGVLRIREALARFRVRGGVVNAYVGVDLGGTSHEALMTLLANVDALYVVHSESSQTFHPKIYSFVGDERSLTVVGSNNLTGGGLWTNFESSVFVSDAPGSESDLQSSLEEYLLWLRSMESLCIRVTTTIDIDELLSHGYVSREIDARLSQRGTDPLRSDRAAFFGRGVPSFLPRLSAPTTLVAKTDQRRALTTTSSAPSSAPETEVGQVTWFETRAMTGGSRNILDLSMKSLIVSGDPEGTPYETPDPKYMCGGIELFGVDPRDLTARKDITLHFEGRDYHGNTLLFPPGDKANGTWRLQLKGVDSSGRKITDAFASKGGRKYLVDKILTFSEVSDGYYSLAVFSNSELERFKNASVLVAHNGPTTASRLLGVI